MKAISASLLTSLFALLTMTCFAQKATDLHGRLKVSGNQLTNEQGIPVQLKGFNTYNLTYWPQCSRTSKGRISLS